MYLLPCKLSLYLRSKYASFKNVAEIFIDEIIFIYFLRNTFFFKKKIDFKMRLFSSINVTLSFINIIPFIFVFSTTINDKNYEDDIELTVRGNPRT